MKTAIKLFASLTIILGLAITTFGQQNASATITGLANVATQVTVAGGGSLEFGNVTPGNVKTVSNSGVVGPGIIGGTTEAAGKFTVSKGVNTQVTLAFTLPSNLTSGSANLPISFADYSSTKCARIAKTSQTDVPFTPSAGITVANLGSTVWAFASNSFDVYIGGTVTPDGAQTAGAYTGNITLTATYN